MCEDTDQSNQQNCWQILPVEIKDILDEVDNRSCHNNKENKHRNSSEGTIKDGIKKIAKRYLKKSNPLCSFKSIFFIKGKVLVCAEYVDTNRQTA